MTTTTPQPTTDRTVTSLDRSETIWFLETAAESGGERTYVEAELGAGKSVPLHFHLTFTERFEVLEGELAVQSGGETHRLGPGDRADAPLGEHHRFFNEGKEPVRFRCALEPASRGFEEAQQIMAGLAADGLMRGDLPRDPRHLGILMALADSGLSGPMRLLAGPLRLLGALGRRQGLETQLRDRYVRW